MSGMHEVPNTGYKKPKKNGAVSWSVYYPEEDIFYIGINEAGQKGGSYRHLFEGEDIIFDMDKDNTLFAVKVKYFSEDKRNLNGILRFLDFDMDFIEGNLENISKRFSKEPNGGSDKS